MRRNIFSDNSSQVSIFVYTESFLDEEPSFLYFNNARKLDGIQIYYMPVLDNQNRQLPIVTGAYRSWCQEGRTFTAIEFPQYSGIVNAHYPANSDRTDYDNNKLAEEKILQDESFSNLYDYVVCSDKWCQTHRNFRSVISFSECKEVLRLFLIMKKRFTLCEHFSCDETMYYVYHHKNLFDEFQNFWSACVASGYISDWANALDNRLLLLSMCIDNAKIEAYKTQNNATAMQLKYHISYLLLLITGTFDNLAWLVNNLYNLGMEEKERTKIDLLKKEFRQKIEKKSFRIHEILVKNDFINRVEAIRELRDRIVHRDFINTIFSRRADGSNQNYLWVDRTVSDKLKKAGFPTKGFILKISDETSIDILMLIDFLQNTTIQMVNELLKNVSDEIYDSRHQYTIWKLLDFPTQPYVL